jgi:transcriptional antiterminator
MEFLNMSQKEIDRLTLLTKVKENLLTQVKASELLGISDRQVRNLLHKLDQLGPQGLISQKRGKASNRKTKASSKELILRIIQEYYQDFGPTFAIEKLKENHQILISRETLRKWLIEAHLWIPKVKKRNRHLLRKRREFFGELIQGDGSHHDWFERIAILALF